MKTTQAFNNNNEIILDKNQNVNKTTANGYKTFEKTVTMMDTKSTASITTKAVPEFDNFANFDDFPTTNDQDFFAEFNENLTITKQSNYDGAFGDIRLNSTTVDDVGVNKTSGDFSATTEFSDRCMGRLSDTERNATIIPPNTENIHKKNNHHNNNVNEDNFDEFASFMTNDTKRDFNSKTNNTIISYKKDAFGFDDDEGSFADFNSINAYDALKPPDSFNYTPHTLPTTKSTSTKKLKPIQSTDYTKLSIGDEKKSLSSDAVDAIKIPMKFASDYSKTNEFDDDLQKVLQRSLVDQ